MKFNGNVGGVIITIDDIQFKEEGGGCGGEGRILNELPYIHFEVSFKCLVFSPVVGKLGAEDKRMTLPATINKISAGHVGLLVYGVFNASVSGELLGSCGYEYEQIVNEDEEDDYFEDPGCDADGNPYPIPEREGSSNDGIWKINAEKNNKGGDDLEVGGVVMLEVMEVREVGGVISIEGKI